MARAGLGAQPKQKLMEFKVLNCSAVVVTNATKIDCIRSVLTTAEAAANKLSGANTSALIRG